MVLPIPSGRFRVGVIEADVPCPSSAVGVVPVVIYYPCLAELEGAPREELPWLAPAYAGALGSVLFSRLVGAYCADVLMSAVGPAGTDYAMVRAVVRAAPAPAPSPEGWPTAVLSHGLFGWRHINSSFLAEIASHGAIAIHVEHCDGSACLARSSVDQRVLAEYVAFDENVHGKHHALRHGQLEQRHAEILAALDGANAALAAALGASVTLARVDRAVAVLGQSFGGATAARCVLRDDGGRFSRALLYDPWVQGCCAETRFPLQHADYDSPSFPSASLERLAVWRNAPGSTLHAACSANCELLVQRVCEAGGLGVIFDFPTCAHTAQTDAPTIFGTGPLAFVYRAFEGSGEGELDAATALAAATQQTLATLEGWFAPALPEKQPQR